MGGWWVADFWKISPMLLIAWAAWVIVSITLHELAHGWAAIAKGDRTPIELGRMTFNPVVHMGMTSLIAFALLGIAWGMMPVNPSRMRGRHADAFVAAAGPAMNIALALVCIVLLAAWELFTQSAAGSGVPEHVERNASLVFWSGAMLNVVLFLLNMIPIPPLDGSRILASFSPGYERLFAGPNGQYVALGLFLLMFFFGVDVLFRIASIAVESATTLLLFPFV